MPYSLRPFCLAIGLLVTYPYAITINHGPWLTNPTDSSMDVTWTTDLNAVSRIYYGESQALGQEAYRVKHGLIQLNTKISSIRITGLKPGTRYYYKAFSKEIVSFQPYSVQYGGNIESAILTFTTLDKQKQTYSFVAMSDIHGNATSHDTQLKSIAWPNVDFVAYTGDMVDYFDSDTPIGSFLGQDQIFRGWLDVAVTNYAKQKPMVYLMGNHEVRGDKARELETFFPTHANGEYYYSFNHGRVHFMVMHSGEDKADCNVSYGCGSDGIAWMNAFDPYRAQEAEWLKRDVQSPEFKNSDCRILLMHIPLSSGYAGQEMNRLWLPILQANPIQAMLVGHTHTTGYKPKTTTMPAELMNSKTSIIRGDVSPTGVRLTLTELDGSKVHEFTTCADVTSLSPSAKIGAAPLVFAGKSNAPTSQFSVAARGEYRVELYDTRGNLVLQHRGVGPERFSSKSKISLGVYNGKLWQGKNREENFTLYIAD